MKASVHSIRIAPKKANLIAKMVRGMPVADAMEALRRTHKKAARIVEILLRSAIANASHNMKQDAQTMVIREIIVNQGQAYRRGVPMARGRIRPMKKFLSHISIELGFPEIKDTEKKSPKSPRSPKSPTKDAAQKSKTSAHTPKSSSVSSDSSVSSASSK